jgi:DNA-directed RNA polymerase specialized sigma24 family protein
VSQAGAVVDLDEHLAEIVAGDADAFARWVAGAEPSLRCALRPLAAQIDAEAIVQETLIRVWQTAPRFTPDGRPNGLLRLAVRVACNLALSERRRLRTSAAPPDMIERLFEEAGAIDVQPAPDPLLRRHIEECRDKLPDKPGQALRERLACSGGEPDERLAARLGMRLNTFLQNFTRARRLLAECLEAHGLHLEELGR